MLSSEMLFAFPHHLSQIIEEEERQSSRNSEDLTPEIRKKKEAESEGDCEEQQITLSNSGGSTKDTNIGEKEKESLPCAQRSITKTPRLSNRVGRVPHRAR